MKAARSLTYPYYPLTTITVEGKTRVETGTSALRCLWALTCCKYVKLRCSRNRGKEGCSFCVERLYRELGIPHKGHTGPGLTRLTSSATHHLCMSPYFMTTRRGSTMKLPWPPLLFVANQKAYLSYCCLLTLLWYCGCRKSCTAYTLCLMHKQWQHLDLG